MVTGHTDILKNLALSVNNGHLANCYLFCGPEGIGKKTIAKEFVKMIFCKSENKPCGECINCRRIENGNFPDIIYVKPESDRKTIGVDGIRDVVSATYVKPFEADRKVFVVNNAETLTEAAQNVFLKSLEEPPEYVIFILVTQNRGAIIDTVQSRSRVIQVNPNTLAEVEGYLKANFPDKGEELAFAADYACGSIGRAIDFLNDETFALIRQTLYAKLFDLYSGDKLKAYDLSAFMGENKPDISRVLDLCLLWYRDALVHSTGRGEHITNRDKSAQIEAFCEKLSAKGASDAMQLIFDAKSKLDANANFDLTMLDMCVKLCNLK